MTSLALLLLAATLGSAPRITTWKVPERQIPTAIVRHGDSMWFVSWTLLPLRGTNMPLRGTLGQITTRGRFRMKLMPPDHMPGLTTHASDGTLWLSDAQQPVLWRVSKRGRVESVKAAGITMGIAFGPDGHLWCTHPASAVISRFDTTGRVQGHWKIPYDAPMTSAMLPPEPGPKATWIVAGPDGALWFCDRGEQPQLGRITTAGEITLFPLPPEMPEPAMIVAGVDDSLWFSARTDSIGRITTAGKITVVPLVTMDVEALAAGSRGRIWFAGSARAGYIDRDGTITEFPVRGANRIRSIAEGPDGALWFADQGNYTIGRIEVK